MCKDPEENETWDPKFCSLPCQMPPHPSRCSLPTHSGINLSTSSWEMNLALPEETVMASLEAVAMWDNVGASRDPPLTPLFGSRPITRLKPLRPLKVRYKTRLLEVCYTLKELPEFSNLYRQNSREHVWGRIPRVQDNDEKNIKSKQAKFIDMGSLRRDSAFVM